jgi:hypothetical protein
MADVKVSRWTKVNLCSGIILIGICETDFMFSWFLYRFPNDINREGCAGLRVQSHTKWDTQFYQMDDPSPIATSYKIFQVSNATFSEKPDAFSFELQI